MNDALHPSPTRLIMVSDHAGPLPATSPPNGYTFTSLVGDEGLSSWLAIWREAHPAIGVDVQRFRRAFGHDDALIAQRVTLLLAPDGRPVGTAAAWFGEELTGERIGCLHWFAVRPSAQGRGLGTALLGHVVQRLRSYHARSYLVTQSDRLGAIRLYLKFGYVPHAANAGADNVWRLTLAALRST